MLTTATRFVQAQDPTLAVPRPCATATVTADVYQATTAVPAAAPSIATRPLTTGLGLTAGNPWSVIGRKAMSKVDFHDRWPLHSTS